MIRNVLFVGGLLGMATPGWAQQKPADVQVILAKDTATYGLSPALSEQTHASYDKLMWQQPNEQQDKIRSAHTAFISPQRQAIMTALRATKAVVSYEIKAFYRADGTAEYVIVDLQPQLLTTFNADGSIEQTGSDRPTPENEKAAQTILALVKKAYVNPLKISFGKPFYTQMAGMSNMSVATSGGNFRTPRTVRTGDSTISTLEAARLTTRPDTVRYVFFNQLNLKTVPDELYRFQNLEELDLSKNELTQLPLRLTADLPNLKRLSLLENQVGDDGIFFAKNTHLEALNMQYNKLTRVPGSVSNNRHLGSLWLGHNELNDLTIRPLKKLKRLYDLNLYEAGLTSIPRKIWKLKHLTILDLYHNELTALPKQMGKMKALEQLAVANNRLTELPKELAKLPRLTTLFAHHNKLTQLPTEMARLTNLRLLDIGTNQFSELPPVILSLPSLEDLDLSKNNIQTLPSALAQMTKLKKLYMRSNPITKDDAKVGPYAKVIDQLEANKTEVFY